MSTFDDYVAAAGRGRFSKCYRYGDVVEACGGDRAAGAQAVGTAARTRADFPCASHFVPNDWRLTDDFKSPLGDGRGEWIKRLEADGIELSDDGVIAEHCRGDVEDLR